MNKAADEIVLSALLLGTARQKPQFSSLYQALLARAENADLKALAVLGQRLQLRPKGIPQAFDQDHAIVDSRRVMPDEARELLRRLLSDKQANAQDIVACAVADAMERGQFCLHPFDLPRFNAFVSAQADLLGASAAAWVARNAPQEEKANDYFSDAPISAENWQGFWPAARAKFISDLRANEPDGARALVEANFGKGPAAVRLRLLKALSVRLSDADQAFLEQCLKDRAPTVREAATRMLARLPGSAAHQDMLKQLLGRLKQTTAGLLRRRTVLTLDVPANLPQALAGQSADATAQRWAIATFGGVALPGLAKALNMRVPDMVEAAKDDAALTALLLHMASRARDYGTLRTLIYDRAPDAWGNALVDEDDGQGFADTAAREAWCAAVLNPARWSRLRSLELARLYMLLRHPLPEPQARALLASRAWTDWLKLDAARDAVQQVDAMLMRLAMAALMPRRLRADFRARIVSQPADQSMRAALLTDCLALLETDLTI